MDTEFWIYNFIAGLLLTFGIITILHGSKPLED